MARRRGRRRGERGQSLVEVGLIVSFIAIFVIATFLTVYDFQAQKLLGRMDSYEGESKAQIRKLLFDQMSGGTGTDDAVGRFLTRQTYVNDPDDVIPLWE